MDGKLPPPNPNLPYREDCWSEGETAALVDAWGSRYIDLNRGSLRQPQWREVADAVNTRPGASARRRPPRTDIQCKNRVDTLKKKYKTERARGGPSPWLFYRQLDILVGPTLSAAANAKKPSPPRGGLAMLRRRPSPDRSLSPPYSPMPPHMSALPITNSRRGSTNLPAADAVFDRHKAAAAAAAADYDSDDDAPYNNNNTNYDDEEASQQSASRSVSSRSGGTAAAAAPLGGVGSKRKRGGGFGELAMAMETFADMYERMEAAKQRHAEEMEKQRINFLKDLELKRMQAFVDMQLQLSRVKHAKNGASEMLMSLAALPFLSNPAYL